MADSAVEISVRKARKGDIALQRALAEMYADAFQAVVAEQQALARYVEQQKAKGAPVSPSWANRDARYMQLQSRIYQTLAEFGNGATGLLSKRVPGLVHDSLARTRSEISSLRPEEPGLVYPSYDNEAWSLINKKAMLAASAIVSDLDSPLRQLLARDLPEAGVEAFRQEWSKGLLTGKNPNLIAKQVVKRISQLSLSRAQLIARTEFHRAYREGKRSQYLSTDTVSGWTWRAACDRRTCAVCWGMHGTVHDKYETLEGHPNCRCVMVPMTRSWEELGIGNVSDTRPQIESGEDRFARLPPSMQQQILGPGRYKMYQEGRSLQSMIGRRESPLWGGQLVLEPIGRTRVTTPPKPPTEPGKRTRSDDPAQWSREEWDDYMLQQHGMQISGPLSSVERMTLKDAYDDMARALGFDLNKISPKVKSSGTPHLGDHPLQPGYTIPAYYQPALNTITLSESALAGTGRVRGGEFGNLNGLKGTAIHEMSHAIHSSLLQETLLEWRKIHMATSTATAADAVTKQLNRIIQLNATAKKTLERYQQQLASGELSEDYLRNRIATQEKVIAGYTRQIAALKDIKAAKKAQTDVFVSDYASNNEFEDFAESLTLFATNPGRLQAIAPSRYSFFRQLFSGGRAS